MYTVTIKTVGSKVSHLARDINELESLIQDLRMRLGEREIEILDSKRVGTRLQFGCSNGFMIIVDKL